MTDDDDRPMRLYTLHTRAPIDQVREVALLVATKAGHTAFLEEQPSGFAVIGTRPLWTRHRWIAALAVNTAVALAYHFMPNFVSGIAGYLIGWLVACAVFLW